MGSLSSANLQYLWNGTR